MLGIVLLSSSYHNLGDGLILNIGDVMLLKQDILKELQAHIDKLTLESKEIEDKQQEAAKKGCISSTFFSFKRIFHDEIAIKSDKLRALKNIKSKLTNDEFKSASDYHNYINKQYRPDPRISTSRVFSGFFNKTESLIEKVGKYLGEQEKVKQTTKSAGTYYDNRL